MSTYIVSMLGNCHKSDFCGLATLQYLNDLHKSYRLSEYGDVIGMDHWGVAAKSKREKQQWSLKANALNANFNSKAAKELVDKKTMEDLLDNLWYPEDESGAEVAPSIYNMPLGVAMAAAPGEEFPEEFMPDKHEVMGSSPDRNIYNFSKAKRLPE